MWVYSVIMLIVAAVLIAVGAATHGGRTELIHSYHQQRVTDKSAYGRAMGRGLIVMGVFFSASGVITLFFRGERVMQWAMCAVAVGLAAGLALIICAQIKYN
ncbi:MAG: DUF3784 domain-containing protein, partial [Clostridia bacterium]|nr:DUF3784 domain-containing protein [Clostridia bacterium]